MKWLLDTNACIRYITGVSSNLARRVNAVGFGDLCTCSIVKAEMYFGSAKSVNPAKSRALQDAFFALLPSLVFNDAAAEIYGNIRSELAKVGRPIGPNDLMIASIALANQLTLVTHNTSEFARVSNLKIEDWEIP